MSVSQNQKQLAKLFLASSLEAIQRSLPLWRLLFHLLQLEILQFYALAVQVFLLKHHYCFLCDVSL